MPDTMLENLKWLGHDGFLLQVQGKNIYFDPYQIQSGLPKADILLITHEHHDHYSPKDVELLLASNTVIVTEKKVANKIKDKGRLLVLLPGEETSIDGINITAVPAYNVDKKFHPKKNNWLGFIVRAGDVSLYHAGDTDFIAEMADVKADIALLPVGGTYTMTANEAIKAALLLQPKIAIPMHYGSAVGTVDDAQKFAHGLKNKIRVEILA